MVQKYILTIRVRGGSIDTSVVISAAKGIVKSVQRSQLVEYGGRVERGCEVHQKEGSHKAKSHGCGICYLEARVSPRNN